MKVEIERIEKGELEKADDDELTDEKIPTLEDLSAIKARVLGHGHGLSLVKGPRGYSAA